MKTGVDLVDHKQKEIESLRELGFKFRNKKRYIKHTKFNQYIAVNIINQTYQIEVDGVRIYTNEMSMIELFTILNILLKK